MDDYSGIYQIWSKIIDIPTSVDVKIAISIDDNYFLSNNYPNPFNPNTVIEYYLPVSSNVSIKVFDITGKEVITLVDELKMAGNHKILFDAGKYNLSSGVYFYALSANGYYKSKPMLLLK